MSRLCPRFRKELPVEEGPASPIHGLDCESVKFPFAPQAILYSVGLDAAIACVLDMDGESTASRRRRRRRVQVQAMWRTVLQRW